MRTELQTLMADQPMPSWLTQPQAATDLPPIHHLPVQQVIQQKLESINALKWESDQENAFLVADLGEVYRQHLRWKALLPRIEPFYAIKSNPNPLVAKLLAELGVGFDCASKSEIQQVLELGVEPDRIIYANPCKQASFIRYANHRNVAKLVFDNEEELYKTKKMYPDAQLVLRVLTDDSKSLIQLGTKFGASPDAVPELLQTAKDLDLNVIGVSFHVGSGCQDEHAFEDAVLRARKVFDIGSEMGFNFTFLDVGGGFSGADVQDGITFEKVAKVLGAAVDAHFPADVQVIAEPGRYYVTSAFTVCTHVIGRRTVKSESEPQYMYYINDGIYGSFNGILFDHQEVHPQVLARGRGPVQEGEKMYTSSVWGPTCDSFDCMIKGVKLPLLEDGDWLFWENMGAYSISSASQFNGFQLSKIIYTNSCL